MTTKPSRNEREQRDKPALIDLILQLSDRIAQLEDRTSPPPSVEQRYQPVERPPILVQVIEVQRDGCSCPACGTAHRAAALAGMEPERCSGARLPSLIAALIHLQQCSYDRLAHLRHDVCGRSSCPGALDT